VLTHLLTLNNFAIRFASQGENIEVVSAERARWPKLLLLASRVDPSTLNNCAILNASANGHVESGIRGVVSNY
jgi:hypothetical protein